MKSWFKEKADSFEGQLLFDEPLAKHTYYRIGGPADLVAIPKSLSDLKLLSEYIRTSGTEFLIFGLGSNVLASDAGFRGIIVKASRINLGIETSKTDGLLTTGGSVAVSSLLRRCSAEGWGGLEFLTGIPGSIGGVVRMNAGTHLGEAKDNLVRVNCFSFETPDSRTYQGDELRFEYRKNLFMPPTSLVVSAEWRVKLEPPDQVKARIDETLRRRKATQPIDFPSCGSVFKNPRASGLSAWQVLDRLSLRGHRIGNAQISEKHSNFILNLGGAKATDVRGLIDLAKSRAAAELGVELEEEVRYVGEWSGFQSSV